MKVQASRRLKLEKKGGGEEGSLEKKKNLEEKETEREQNILNSNNKINPFIERQIKSLIA